MKLVMLHAKLNNLSHLSPLSRNVHCQPSLKHHIGEKVNQIGVPPPFLSRLYCLQYISYDTEEIKWMETWYLIIVYRIPKSAKFGSTLLFHTCNILNKIKHLAQHFVFINYNISKESITKEREEKKKKSFDIKKLRGHKPIYCRHPSYFQGSIWVCSTHRAICFTPTALAVI